MQTYEEIDELLKKGQDEIRKNFKGNIKEMLMPSIAIAISASLIKIANSLKIIADKETNENYN